VTALLTEHREKLESLVAGLLEEETLDQDAAYSAAQVDPHAVPHATEEPTVA
jgi:ATP-dependent Zn protease